MQETVARRGGIATVWPRDERGPRARGTTIIERTLFGFIWAHSKRDQIILLVVTACLFPLLYLTLELPKRIINDAIGAQSSVIDVWGYQISQITFLAVLCAAFLAAVLLHGLVKMRINTMKGVLAERMLRRFRYQLIRRILLFPHPYFERVSQGELVSMITAESEPMGGLMGDAISQPVLQAGQMLTILGFLFAQSFWFGLAACAMIPVQAWLIPRLQRQINLLNKSRIKEVRVLAGQISESASGVTALRAHGGWRYRLAQISNRLAVLYEIRFEIYQKKFFMKFLNNFIGQLTPFFFYAIGGYLVLQGLVSLGALVAALAAYKDLSSPWKELLDYYNQTQDMSLRWEVVTERFAPSGMMDESLFEGEPTSYPRLTDDIALEGVTIRDADGNTVLENLSTVLPAGRVIGIHAPSAEDRRALAELFIREVLPASGKVRIGELDLKELHHGVIAQRIGLAAAAPKLFQGTFGDNVLMPIRRRPLGSSTDPDRFAETLRAGNSVDPFNTDWDDVEAAGVTSRDELRRWWVRLIEGMGPGNALFRRGLDQQFSAEAHPELAERLVGLRSRVRFALHEAGLERQLHPLDRDLYNPALPVGENLLFATPLQTITPELLADQTEFLAQLKDLGLDATLVSVTEEVIDMLRRIFGHDGTDHPLFRNLGIDAQTYESALDLVERTKTSGIETLGAFELAQLLTIPFRISAEAVGAAFSDDIRNRILGLRKSHAGDLLRSLEGIFVPLDRGEFSPGLTVLENALFGKISQDAGARADGLRRLVANALVESGAQELVVQLIYDLPIALSGANLSPTFAEPLEFTRATIKRPDILILADALSSYPGETRAALHDTLRELLPETTLIYLSDTLPSDISMDMVLEVQQGRIVSEGMAEQGSEDTAASADLSRKVRALEQTDLFSGLNRRQLRLLAFGARWYDAPAGEVVFLKDAQPTDGAYMIIDGEAGLYLPREGQPEQLIARVGPGTLVGELGLIRNEPRALTMQAETDLRCLRIGAKEFLAVVENDAATAFKLLQVVAGYVSN